MSIAAFEHNRNPESTTTSDVASEQIDQNTEILKVDKKIEPTFFGATDDPAEILVARQITATRYLEEGYITPDEVGEDGIIIDDPYVNSSRYYVAKTAEGEVVATVREILYDPEKGEASFPVLAHKDELDPDVVADIEATGLEHCIEFSTLAKREDVDEMATLMLYRTMWQDAFSGQDKDDSQKIWLMAAKPALYRRFKMIFNGAIAKMGKDGQNLDYPGEAVTPAIMKPIEGLTALVGGVDEKPRQEAGRRLMVELLIDGIDRSKLSEETQELLLEKGFSDEEEEDDDIPKEEGGAVSELLKKRKPEVIAAAGLLAYTALRTFLVKEGLPDTDWRVFLGIEAATTPPYTWAAGEAIRGLVDPLAYSAKRRAVSAATFLVTLLAPYAYVASTAGSETLKKPEVAGAIGLFAVISVAGVARGVHEARHKAEEPEVIEETDVATVPGTA